MYHNDFFKTKDYEIRGLSSNMIAYEDWGEGGVGGGGGGGERGSRIGRRGSRRGRRGSRRGSKRGRRVWGWERR